VKAIHLVINEVMLVINSLPLCHLCTMSNLPVFIEQVVLLEPQQRHGRWQGFAR